MYRFAKEKEYASHEKEKTRNPTHGTLEKEIL